MYIKTITVLEYCIIVNQDTKMCSWTSGALDYIRRMDAEQFRRVKLAFISIMDSSLDGGVKDMEGLDLPSTLYNFQIVVYVDKFDQECNYSPFSHCEDKYHPWTKQEANKYITSHTRFY